MANLFQAGDPWTLQPLRGNNAAYLSGYVRPGRALPSPVAIAQGPRDQTNSAAIGASEHWVLDTTIPAADLCWVVVQANIVFQYKSGVETPQHIYWYPQGNNGLATALTGPALGPGSDLVFHEVASGGTYVSARAQKYPTAPSLWLPLDPNNTLAGVATSLCIRCSGTGGVVADDWSVKLDCCRMLGFPTAAWASGALWEPLSARGS